MSFPRYTNYKATRVTWLRTIPSHWSMGQSRRRFRERRERAKEFDRQLTASQKLGVVFQDEYAQIEGQRVMQVIKGADILKHVEPGDFVISMRSFEGGLEWSQRSGSISSAYVMLVPNGDVHGPFFAHLFKSRPYIHALQATSNLVRDGQAMRFENFAKIDLPILPIEEQIGIAKFLDRELERIDTLVAEQHKLVDLLNEKRQAVISHAVTKGLNPDAPMKPSGVEWLGDIPAHWNVAPIRRTLAAPLANGIFKTKEQFGEGLRLINVIDVYQQDFRVDFDTLDRVRCDDQERQTYEVRSGDLLLVRSSLKAEGIAAVALATAWSEPVVFECHLIRLRPDPTKLDPGFGCFALNSSPCRWHMFASSKVTTMTTIDQESILAMPLPIPVSSEQRAIVDYLRAQMDLIDAFTGEAKRVITLLRERRTALISAAVTGQIDVRGLAQAGVA